MSMRGGCMRFGWGQRDVSMLLERFKCFSKEGLLSRVFGNCPVRQRVNQ